MPSGIRVGPGLVDDKDHICANASSIGCANDLTSSFDQDIWTFSCCVTGA
ncbi:hypothetical protein [Roseisalinus antarcticus]|nr:hypothetical protein [Roseisalinus antarcticus]